MPLSAIQVKQALPKTKTYKLNDGQGLSLQVTPKGAKRWRHRYYFNGKEKMLSLGLYPWVSLQEARTKRDEQRRLLAQGIDPSAARSQAQQDLAKQEISIFQSLAAEWFRTQSNRWEKKSAKRIWSRIENHLIPALKDMPINEIDANLLLKTLSPLEQQGKLNTVRKLRQYLDQIFRFAAVKNLTRYNPVNELKGIIQAPKQEHYPHPKTQKGITEILSRIGQCKTGRSAMKALQIAPYVFLRPSELALGEWREIDFVHALWEIPASRMKMSEPHLVPLSSQVVTHLQELKAMELHEIYLFPGTRKPTKPISDGTLRMALRRAGISKEELTPHGFRGMASTQLNELGYNRDWIERQLAHRESNNIRAAYNHAQYLEQRIIMMQEWADYLDNLRVRDLSNPA